MQTIEKKEERRKEGEQQPDPKQKIQIRFLIL